MFASRQMFCSIMFASRLFGPPIFLFCSEEYFQIFLLLHLYPGPRFSLWRPCLERRTCLTALFNKKPKWLWFCWILFDYSPDGNWTKPPQVTNGYFHTLPMPQSGVNCRHWKGFSPYSNCRRRSGPLPIHLGRKSQEDSAQKIQNSNLTRDSIVAFLGLLFSTNPARRASLSILKTGPSSRIGRVDLE